MPPLKYQVRGLGLTQAQPATQLPTRCHYSGLLRWSTRPRDSELYQKSRRQADINSPPAVTATAKLTATTCLDAQRELPAACHPPAKQQQQQPPPLGYGPTGD